MTDQEWLALMHKDAKKGRRALIEQYGNLVYAIVLNKLKASASREDIEDCVSDVFVAVFTAADSFSLGHGTLKTYISTIAKRTAIDAWRKISYRQNTTGYLEEAVPTELPSEEETPEETVSRSLQKQRLWEIVRSLGEPDTTIVIRQYFYEQTAREIGKALSMTAAAVQKRSVRARQRIKELLEADGYDYRKGDAV